MKHVLEFLKKIREMRNIKREGILYYGVKEKDVDSASDHTFRLATMVWLFGQKRRLNLAKAFKLALVHEFCKVYTGDITPYDGLFSKTASKKHKDKYALAWRWRRLSLKEKQSHHKKKFDKERKGLEKLIKKLPLDTRKDIMATWLDFQSLGSKEANFVHQLDRTANLLEALECWEKDKSFPTIPWWEHMDESVDDPALLDFASEIEKEELRKA